jgi:serine/threonine-protein kinase
MGVVYAAIHALIAKRAALKVIRAELRGEPALIDRFVHEARVVNQIGHPDVVDVFHIGWLDDGRVYLVMEFLTGRTLAQRLRRGPLSTRDGVALLARIAAPVIAAHARGVVHRDLKPDNIFLVDDGPRIKVLDWGLSTMASAPGLPGERGLVGTPRYLAPEQARCRAVNDRTDVYALGVVAYEVLLGRAPFHSHELTELLRMHIGATPPRPRTLWPAIPDALDDLLTAMLAKDPSERPSLACVQATLAMLGDDLPERAGGALPLTLAAADDENMLPAIARGEIAKTWDLALAAV